ncbi:MAG: NAD(P)/FAD-dependent oxidoreductase [Candidatus Nanopelagicales bacterium]
MNIQYDAVVVGGRVAGAGTALLLARSGLSVAVVDRARRGTDTVSTHAFMRAGVLQLDRWGLLPAVRAAGTPPVRRTLFHYPGQTVQVTIRPSAGVDALYAPRRTVLDPIVLDAAAEAGAHVLERTAVVGLLHEGDRVAGVRVRAADGVERVIRGRLTIGADGIRSDVAAAVAAPLERSAAASGAVLYAYRAGLPTAGYEWAYGQGAAAGLIPTNGGLTCVFAGSSPERYHAARRRGAEAALRELFAAAAPEHVARFDGSALVGPVHGWAGVTGFVRRSWGPGWALVGDAGYFKDPITTHGMTDALRDAELLSRAVVVALSSSVAESDALAAYQRKRDTLSERLFDVTDRIAAYRWSPAEASGLLREAGSAMTDEVEFLQQLHSRGGSVGSGRVGDTPVL